MGLSTAPQATGVEAPCATGGGGPRTGGSVFSGKYRGWLGRSSHSSCTWMSDSAEITRGESLWETLDVLRDSGQHGAKSCLGMANFLSERAAIETTYGNVRDSAIRQQHPILQ